MGKLLTDVLILKDEGLVGFTEDGEQVPLNVPEPNACVWESNKEEVMKIVNDRIESSNNKTYFHLGQGKSTLDGFFIQPYNIYTLRE